MFLLVLASGIRCRMKTIAGPALSKVRPRDNARWHKSAVQNVLASSDAYLECGDPSTHVLHQKEGK
jgi:hypothetical protein